MNLEKLEKRICQTLGQVCKGALRQEMVKAAERFPMDIHHTHSSSKSTLRLF